MKRLAERVVVRRCLGEGQDRHGGIDAEEEAEARADPLHTGREARAVEDALEFAVEPVGVAVQRLVECPAPASTPASPARPGRREVPGVGAAMDRPAVAGSRAITSALPTVALNGAPFASALASVVMSGVTP